MILIFGGTTEGRAAVKVVEEGCSDYLYSTLGEGQRVELVHGRRLTGALTPDTAEELCRREGVRLIIDAAHPFASGLHATVGEVAARCALPVIRCERREIRDDYALYCADYEEAMRRMEHDGVRRLLALTGVKTIRRLAPFWERHYCRFRILQRQESLREAMEAGLRRHQILFYDPPCDELQLLRRENPDAVLTKESGTSGGLREKIDAARAFGIPIYVIERPPLSDSFRTVYTEAGLRRAIDELLPNFFRLRSGYTTGTCATAAAVAAVELLLTGRAVGEVTVELPGGDPARLKVVASASEGAVARATVRKEAGDDPDVTNGCLITAEVARNELGEIRFLQGEGVGRVTLPGLGIAVGEPAVNPVPRRMIVENFARRGVQGADVRISVAGGAALALKTFNPRLGIVGGISIIGTSGIVRPFSNEAFVASVERAVAVARAVGCERLVLNSGARSERWVRERFADLSPQAFVQYGNFVGEALASAARHGFSDAVIGMMIGKAVKLAEGHLDTHSRRVTLNRQFLKELAVAAGCSGAAVEAIGSLTLARELWERLDGEDCRRLMRAVVDRCREHCAPLLPNGRLQLLLISEEGTIFE